MIGILFCRQSNNVSVEDLLLDLVVYYQIPAMLPLVKNNLNFQNDRDQVEYRTSLLSTMMTTPGSY